MAFFKDPDYCFIVDRTQLRQMREALAPLLKAGGLYFTIHELRGRKDERALVLYFDDVLLDVMGELLKIKCRLSNHKCMLEYKCYASDLFEQFDNTQTQSIVVQTLNMHFDIGYFIKSKIILQHFPMHSHEEERNKIVTSWNQYGNRLSVGFLTGKFEENMQPLNFIKDYYGAKFGFYFAWLVHYTGMLLIPSFVGVVLFIVQIVRFASAADENTNWLEAFNTPLNSLYAIFVVLWTTYFVESWKRKENTIGNKWLMRDYEDPTTEREDFLAAINIDKEIRATEKLSRVNTFFRSIFIGIPVSLFFILAVVFTQVGMRLWADDLNKQYGKHIPYHLRFLPSIVNVGLIFFYGAVYTRVAARLAHSENHRYQQTHEDSLINKMYMFQFINSYISNYIIAYWVRDFGQLAINLIIILVFKQIGMNLFEWAVDKVLVGLKISKIKAAFKPQLLKLHEELDEMKKEKLKRMSESKKKEMAELMIKIDRLKMNEHIETQLVMAPASETLIFFYNEAIIQLGFITFFACVFPLAPLFSFFTNLLEIRIKLNRMSQFSRRFIAVGASGIGSWTGVMELISLVSIPINLAIMLFTAKGKRQTDEDEVLVREYGYSETVKFFLDQDYTPFDVVLILVFVEHILLGVKVIMATMIPDVPDQVTREERKRPKVVEIAEEEMLKLKRAESLQTMQEIMDSIAASEMNSHDVA